MKVKYVIFDLDDTLIYEIDYLKSAFYEIASFVDNENRETLFNEMLQIFINKSDVYEYLNIRYRSLTKEHFLNIYRNHFPRLVLNNGASDIFFNCKILGYKLGLITDGRSVTQRNKLKALKIEGIFDKIVISEEFGSSKPDDRNYTIFLTEGISEYLYIGDNISKDFITPNKLGWTTICLKSKGENIHSQDFDLEEKFLPKYNINSLSELSNFL